MGNGSLRLADLAERGDLAALENRWLEGIDPSGEDREDRLRALSALVGRGKAAEAAALGWTWLTTLRESAEPSEILALGRELLLRCGDSQEIRQEVLACYREAFPDRPELARLIELSGLGGQKSPRRALRTLEICLGLKIGDCLLARSDEHAAVVTAVDSERCVYTVKSRQGTRELDADALALAYDAANENDFRVLAQLFPERIGEMLRSDPVGLVVSLLRSHRGRLDSDELEHLLCPRYLPAGEWASWWSRVRAQLRKSPHVVLEGRNPVVLTWHEGGRTLEDELEPQWVRCESPAQRLGFIELYLRECRHRGSAVQPAMIRRMHAEVMRKVETLRKAAPGDALAEALVIDRLTAEPAGADLPAPAAEILAAAADVPGLLRQLSDSALYLRALGLIRRLRPTDWIETYAALLPTAPQEGCDLIAGALREAGREDLLRQAVEAALGDFTNCLDAVCWIWRGRAGFDPVPPRELLLRLLDHHGRVSRSDHAPASQRRETRTKVRNALSADRYARFREVIAAMEPGLASTIKTTIERLEGLGQVVHGDLIRIILDTHPGLHAVRERVDPWADDTLILATQAGILRREEELRHLELVKIPQNARAIGEAASHGDLSENSEYKFALEERDLLRARVAVIQNELALARVVSPGEIATEVVEFGTRVTLVADDGSRRDLTILGPFEADVEKGVYNYRAPLCRKLRGKAVGETLILDLDGQERSYRVEAIFNALA